MMNVDHESLWLSMWHFRSDHLNEPKFNWFSSHWTKNNRPNWQMEKNDNSSIKNNNALWISNEGLRRSVYYHVALSIDKFCYNVRCKSNGTNVGCYCSTKKWSVILIIFLFERANKTGTKSIFQQYYTLLSGTFWRGFL